MTRKPPVKNKKPKRSDGRMEKKVTVGYKTIVDENGNVTRKQVQKSFYGFTDKEIKQKIAEYFKGIKVENANGSTPFRSLAETWLSIDKEKTVSYVTYKMYEQYVEKVNEQLGRYRIDEITPVMVQKALNEHAGRSESFIDKYKLTLRAIFRFALDNKYIVDDPTKRIKNPETSQSKEKRAYTMEQARYVLNFAKTRPDGFSVVMLLKTGMRKSELIGLEWSSIDAMNKTIDITQAAKMGVGGQMVGKTKNKYSRRTIVIDDELIEYLEPYMEEALKRGDRYVMQSSRRDAPMSHVLVDNSHTEFMDAMAEQAKKDGMEIEKLTQHELRHTVGTLLYESGTDLYDIQLHMGHGRIEQTQHYAKNRIEKRKKTLKLLY